MHTDVDPKDKLALRVLGLDPTYLPGHVEISEKNGDCHFTLKASIATGKEMRNENRKIYPSMAGTPVVILSVLDPSVRIPLQEEDIVIRIESPGVYLLDYGTRYRHGLPDGWEVMFNKLLDYLERLTKVSKDD
ncbi:hypothetical protein D9M68_18910 [compost metagenome]